MSVISRFFSRVAVVPILLVLVAIGPDARAAVPPDIASRIQQAADNWRATQAQQAQMAQFSGDPHMAAVMNAASARIAASFISQAVMDAISRNPADARDVTAAAIRAAPDLAGAIRQNIARAFPLLAQASAPYAPPVATLPAQRPAGVPVAPSADEMSEADQVAAEFASPADDRDSLEGMNRFFFGVNDVLDRWVVVPIAHVYRFLMPETLRGMIRNGFQNLNEPVVAINDLIQGDLGDAGTAMGRFAVNSTVGVLGLFDVAKRIDLEKHHADFGQTLHSYGVGSGTYVVLPLLGPSTVRDAGGSVVDTFLNPLTYLLDIESRLYLAGGQILVKREALLDESADLRAGSVDYYAAVRSAWFQNREAELRKEPGGLSGDK